jgi:hypothetical protein
VALTTLNRRAEKLALRIDSVSHSIVRADADFKLQTFIEGLKIINKRGELVSLIMNRSQEIVLEKVLEAREKRSPARFICLKARQLGISTLVEAIIFALVTVYARRFGMVAAHCFSSARSLFAMTQRFHAHLPQHLRPPLAKNNARMLEYAAPHYSSIRVDTAANATLARGATFHYAHASEVAFWDRAEDAALAISQATPQTWDTLLFWESTANGMNNLFHRMWIAAERGENDIEPIFLTWKDFPSYSLPPSGDHSELKPSDREIEYSELAGLSADQLNWAIHTRKNQCQDSWDKFHQEYPAVARLAFAFTSTPWFNQAILGKWMEDRSNEHNHITGRIQWPDEPDGLSKPEFVTDERGPVSVWSMPQPGAAYCLGMDVGEGVGQDYTVIQVINTETGDVVAVYRSNRTRPEMAGMDAVSLATFYNYGLLGIERNGPGLATLVACERGLAQYPWMTGYTNLYYQKRLDTKLPDESERLGWLTTRPVKEAMLSRLGGAIEQEEIRVYDHVTLLELQGLVWDAENRLFRQHYREPGCKLTHDDSVIALAIANEMRRTLLCDRFVSNRLDAAGNL